MNTGEVHAVPGVPAVPLEGPLEGRRTVSAVSASAVSAVRALPGLRRAAGRTGLARSGLGRAGIAALLAGGRPQSAYALEPVVRAHRLHHPRAELDLALLDRAYQVAEASHRGQMRKSGEPYITHPLAVAMILAQLGAETTTLVAALLHDTVEDTAMTLEQVRDGFGEEVAYLVDGVTKLEKVDFGAAAEAETFRKMLVATGRDVRVMVIKLADRLHNMRTIRHMKPASQIRIATVTRDVLIPLAERLGIQVVKTELEDIVFATLHPDEYAATSALLTADRARRSDAAPARAGADGARAAVAEAGSEQGPAAEPLEAFAGQLRRQLRDARVAAEVSVRPRHCVSLRRARLRRGTELAPTDFGRVLVVVEENADCYAVLGELHTCWSPLPGEFQDYIAAPKFNLYQSLHTSVATEQGEVVEVLVRTARMHQVAEFGVVALGAPAGTTLSGSDGEAGDSGAVGGGGDGGLLVDGGAPGANAEPGEGAALGGAADEAEGRDPLDHTDPARPGWLARLLDWQRETPDPDTFWSQLTADLAGDGEITVLAGHAREGGRSVRLQLPAGATGVDAAYAPGEEHGHRCIGMRLNGRLTALSTPLHDGDTVELLTEPPGEETAGPAPEWLAHARTPGARIAIERWLAGHPEPEPAPGEPGDLPPGSPRARRGDVGQLLGGGPVDASRAVITAPSMPEASVRLARCCTPVPPDELLCFAIRGGGLAAHRGDCPTGRAMRATGRTPVQAHWLESPTPTGYRVTVQADALGRPRLLADLTAAMSGAGVDIISAEVEPPRELQVRHTYTVELPAPEALPELMRVMLRVPGVYDVYRAAGTGGRASGRAATQAAATATETVLGESGLGAADGLADGPGDVVGARNDGDRSPRPVRPSRGMRGRPAALSFLGDYSQDCDS
ncbi:bifunctional (p)ppGpp synthetase/guanosine-3',5'-bis(diphosphate) 3'-pyrophosphohydrolase [Streptacidiphilus pinicola]|uniref:Bifunctional (P)ppGpp synthetase/guanosine-3',5'-bis(Diphosphate) 3'-pyrophosphohydrolase n=1 Tax=Streptacidiphilus pinicola TaxID=2219663 RepID=A0A2X0IMC4_9ACTN|nr:HD domain-containing protein [Streptacidiphilus pinicola]RAG84703.1 bifunctional (p)ppGpp synthetase/guanosine-3',5'-bis(diphosphate) 3'-pyrophosphohydrolase [Streptacidiphilus pinicola]